MKHSTPQTQALLYCLRREDLDIRVEQDEATRWLTINGQRQSQMLLASPEKAIYPYIQQICRELQRHPHQHILQIGLGAGEINRCILSSFQDTQLTTLEKEAIIAELYQRFFQLPSSKSRDQLVIGELAHVQFAWFDAVILDIYPWPTDFDELLTQLLTKLKPQGSLFINLTEPGRSEELENWCWRHFTNLQILSYIGYKNQLFICWERSDVTEKTEPLLTL